MSEAYREPSEDDLSAFGAELEEFLLYTKTIAAFEESQHDLIDAAAAYFAAPTQENGAIIPRTAHTMGQQFVNCLTYIRANIEDETEQKESILQLILEEEARHLDVFTQLLPNTIWDMNRYKREEIRDIIHKVFDEADEEEQITATLTQIFSSGVEVDLNNLFAGVVPIEKPETTELLDIRSAHLRTIGKHALDVVKIGAGVAAGILFAKSLGKK